MSYCLVHGVMMRGVVDVEPRNAKLPSDQEAIQDQIAQTRHKMLDEGRELREKALDIVEDKHVILVGIGSMTAVGMVEIVRFFPTTIKLDVGQTLTFLSESMMPHTFSIGNVSDPFTPVGDASNYTGGPFNRFVPPGASFTLKVTAALKVPYICQFHDTLGMVGNLLAE